MTRSNFDHVIEVLEHETSIRMQPEKSQESDGRHSHARYYRRPADAARRLGLGRPGAEEPPAPRSDRNHPEQSNDGTER